MPGESARPASPQAISPALWLALAAFACACTGAIIVTLDQAGVPERLVLALAPGAALAGLAILGILARTMQMSRFFAGGHRMGAPQAGLACTALILMLALSALPSLQANSQATTEGRALLLALVTGLVTAACLVWPLLRANAAFSMSDMLAARFSLPAFRIAHAGACAAVCALVALAGFRFAAQILGAGTGLSLVPVSVILAGVLACVCVPGGLAGAQRAALAAAAIALASTGCAVIYLMIAGWAAPLQAANAVETTGWQAALAGVVVVWKQGIAAPPDAGMLRLAFAMGLGLAFLPPLALGSLACTNGKTAAKASLATLFWSLLWLALAAIVLAFAGRALAAQFGAGARPPAWVFERGAGGGLRFCGQSVQNLAAAQAACTGSAGFAGTLRAQDVDASGLYLLMSFPRLISASPALRALTSTAGGMLGLATAAMGLHGFATALGHDALMRDGKVRNVLTSARLALTRLVMLVALGLLASAAVALPMDTRAALGLAIALSTTLLVVPFLLAFWPRASSIHALLAMLAGLSGFSLAWSAGSGGTDFDRLASAALVGLALALVTGFGVSLTTRIRPANLAAVRALRLGQTAALQQRPGA